MSHQAVQTEDAGCFLWSWLWSIGATARGQDLEKGDPGVEVMWLLRTTALFLLWVRYASENLIKALDLLPRKMSGAFAHTILRSVSVGPCDV